MTAVFASVAAVNPAFPANVTAAFGQVSVPATVSPELLLIVSVKAAVSVTFGIDPSPLLIVQEEAMLSVPDPSNVQLEFDMLRVGVPDAAKRTVPESVVVELAWSCTLFDVAADPDQVPPPVRMIVTVPVRAPFTVRLAVFRFLPVDVLKTLASEIVDVPETTMWPVRVSVCDPLTVRFAAVMSNAPEKIVEVVFVSVSVPVVVNASANVQVNVVVPPISTSWAIDFPFVVQVPAAIIRSLFVVVPANEKPVVVNVIDPETDRFTLKVRVPVYPLIVSVFATFATAVSRVQFVPLPFAVKFTSSAFVGIAPADPPPSVVDQPVLSDQFVAVPRQYSAT